MSAHVIKRALQDSWTFYIYTASMVIGKVCFINDHNKASRTFCLFLSRQLTFTVTGYNVCTVPYKELYNFMYSSWVGIVFSLDTLEVKLLPVSGTICIKILFLGFYKPVCESCRFNWETIEASK